MEQLASERSADGSDAAARDAARLLSEPCHRAILELTRLPEFQPDVRWLSRMLDLEVDAVNVAVARLARHGLIEIEAGVWTDRSRGRLAAAVVRRVAERAAPSNMTPAPEREEFPVNRPVTQFQIMAKDPDREAEFYCRLFGWKVRADNALRYRRLETGAGRGIDGGIWPAPPDGHSSVQLFVEVSDLAATVDEACRLGGRVVIAPQKLPDGDEMAVIVDPEGLPLGLVRPGPAA